MQNRVQHYTDVMRYVPRTLERHAMKGFSNHPYLFTTKPRTKKPYLNVSKNVSISGAYLSYLKFVSIFLENVSIHIYCYLSVSIRI